MEYNNTFERPWSSIDTQYACFYAVTYVFILISNLMLIYGFYKTSRPFTIITKLFIYLSLVDVSWVSCSVVDSGIVSNGLPLPRYYFIIIFASVYSIIVLDQLILWTISFLRFLSIHKPMYRVNTRTVNKALVVEVFISFLIMTSAGFYLWDSTIDELLRVNSDVVMVLNFTMMLTNLTLNMSSLIILRRSTNSKAQQKGNSVLGNQMVIKRKKMALNTLLLITFVQFVCTLPATCLSFIGLEIIIKYSDLTVLVIGHCLLLTYLGLNSLIVIYRTKSLREYYSCTKYFRCLKIN